MELHTIGIDLAVLHLVGLNLRGEVVGGRRQPDSWPATRT
jgi:hypothetical protein